MRMCVRSAMCALALYAVRVRRNSVDVADVCASVSNKRALPTTNINYAQIHAHAEQASNILFVAPHIACNCFASMTPHTRTLTDPLGRRPSDRCIYNKIQRQSLQTKTANRILQRSRAPRRCLFRSFRTANISRPKKMFGMRRWEKAMGQQKIANRVDSIIWGERNSRLKLPKNRRCVLIKRLRNKIM